MDLKQEKASEMQRSKCSLLSPQLLWRTVSLVNTKVCQLCNYLVFDLSDFIRSAKLTTRFFPKGYTDDQTIKNKDTNTPTFAVLRCFVNTPRWAGVPFIFKAGKALNERKAEMRIQFKDPPAGSFLFESKCPRNELVMRLQPDEAIYIKTNVKTPGFSSDLVQKELEVNYKDRFEDETPDAYTRLILDVLRGRSATFVRSDELIRAWEIFTPLLHRIETENIRPHVYKTGGRGPEAADAFISEKSGYVRNEDYIFDDGEVKMKSNL